MQKTQKKHKRLTTKLIIIATIALLALCAILIPWLTNTNRAYANTLSIATFLEIHIVRTFFVNTIDLVFRGCI